MIILSLDTQYRYLYFNDAHKDIMVSAYDKRVKPGMNMLDCMTNAEDREKAKINFDRALIGESHSTIQEYGEKERYFFETLYSPIINPEEEIIGASGFAQNITKRKKTEIALLESEERFRYLFENAPLGYHSLDIEGNFVELNETWCDLLGYKKNEVLGKNFSEFLHPDSLKVFN